MSQNRTLPMRDRRDRDRHRPAAGRGGARPLVSILMAAFEAEAYIDEAVESALTQSWHDVELVIAPDDGDSYDGLRARCSDGRLRILPPGPQRRSGPGRARNRALDAARGEFFTMLDADDRIAPNHVEDLLRVAMSEGAALAPTRYTGWDIDEIVRIPTYVAAHPAATADATDATGVAGCEFASGAAAAAAPDQTPGSAPTLTLAAYSRALASLHPLQHRSLEPGYCTGFAEDVVHDGLVIARCGAIPLVETACYIARRRPGSLCNGGPEEERLIQASYDARIEQIEQRPSELGLHVLDADDRQTFADLFRLRRFVSRQYAASGAADYQAWIGGREAVLCRRFERQRAG